MKNILHIMVILFFGCADLKHDNRLDPKNPNAEADQIAVVENFVITNTKGTSEPPYVGYSQEALYELKGKYTDGMLILEYHMTPSDTLYQDSLALSDNELRYNNEYRGSAPRGFPHAFFNGKQTGIQGASSKEVSKNRYETILDTMTIHKVKFFCEAEQQISGNQLVITAKIARYGDQPVSGLLVEYILYENLGLNHYYTVRKILTSESVTNIDPGSIYPLPEKTVTIPAFYSAANLGVVILVKDAVSRAVLQAAMAR
jgi:hypothetical protein